MFWKLSATQGKEGALFSLSCRQLWFSHQKVMHVLLLIGTVENKGHFSLEASFAHSTCGIKANHSPGTFLTGSTSNACTISLLE